MEKLNIKTSKRSVLMEITSNITQVVTRSGIKNGLCVVYCPHTTAGITINEAYDPSVQDDVVFAFNKMVPNYSEFRHSEGNSDSHTKTSIIGASQTIIIDNGTLQLGRWQGIYFAEFDGPRQREIWVKLIGT